MWLCWVLSSLQDTLVAACELVVATCRVLVLLPGNKPMPPALGAQALSHWTTRRVHLSFHFNAIWNYLYSDQDHLLHS